MEEELKNFIAKSEKNQRSFLTMYALGKSICDFGVNGFNIGYLLMGFLGKIKLLFRLLIMGGLMLAVEDCAMGFYLYCGIHLAIIVFGGILWQIYATKLNNLEKECQDSLNKFQQEQYKKNGIVRGEKEDEVRYEGNLVVKNGFFEGDIQSELTLIHIYCMKNLKRSDWLDGTLNGCITMRKNVASVEFNNKFNVLVPAQMERDCMKFLSPSRQLEMIRTSAFDRIEQVHISVGKIQGNTQDIVLRPKEQIDIHNCSSIRKVYEEIQEYCQDIRQMADNIQMEYLQIVKIVEA